jgi:hypothetical protein
MWVFAMPAIFEELTLLCLIWLPVPDKNTARVRMTGADGAVLLVKGSVANCVLLNLCQPVIINFFHLE